MKKRGHMIGKIIQVLVELILNVKILRRIGLFIIQKGDIPLRDCITSDLSFIKWYEPWFKYNDESHGAIVFVKRPWGISWLMAPKGWTHVAIWDYQQQYFLDYHFQGNRTIFLSEFFQGYTEFMAFKTKGTFIEKYREVFESNADGKLLCTGLLEETNNKCYYRIYESTGYKNPSPYAIMKKIKEHKIHVIHHKIMGY